MSCVLIREKFTFNYYMCILGTLQMANTGYGCVVQFLRQVAEYGENQRIDPLWTPPSVSQTPPTP